MSEPDVRGLSRRDYHNAYRDGYRDGQREAEERLRATLAKVKALCDHWRDPDVQAQMTWPKGCSAHLPVGFVLREIGAAIAEGEAS